MVSFPYFINKGMVTFKDAIHAYPPLLINILAGLYNIFGYNSWVLKIFAWSTFLINDILIFLLLRKFFKKAVFPIIGLAIYIVLQPILEGNMVWPDLIMVPFLLSGFLLLLNKKYFLAGLSFALALMTKQTAIFYIGCSIIYLVFSETNLKKIINFFAGILVVIMPFILSLIYQNSLNEFLNWTIIYPSKYWTSFPGYVQLSPSLKDNLILLILFLPITFLVFTANRKIFADKHFLILFSFLLCGIVGIYPRFSFFHFQAGIAFLVMLYIYLVSKTKLNPYFLLLIPIIVLLINFNSLQFKDDRFWSDSDIYTSKLIQNETKSDQTIYLLGLNSNLYTFADRIPNKPWLDNFGWYLEIPDVQNKVIEGFEKNPPTNIFWRTPDLGNWYDIGVYEPKMIVSWIEKKYSKEKEIEKGIWKWTRK